MIIILHYRFNKAFLPWFSEQLLVDGDSSLAGQNKIQNLAIGLNIVSFRNIRTVINSEFL